MKASSIENLNEFQNAKISSIKIFKSIYNLVVSFINFNSKFQEFSDSIVSTENLKFLTGVADKSSRIIDILERNQMKCAFFGRTSNGKSSIINAILGKKILPCGIGHTTNCFLQIQGTSEEQGFIQKCDPNISTQNNCKMDTLSTSEHLSIRSVLELGHALSLEKVSNQTLINIYWPYSNCEILKNDVSILDSPGIDIDPEVDYCISHNCLDADVFVLVANSESTLTQAEKEFFHKVNQKVSKPNIFILNNRWEMCDKEDNISETKQQHQSRCFDFLTTELDLCSRDVANQRIYFVSAKEILELRTNQSFNKELIPNFQERYHDFIRFEKNFAKVLCESALQTKFNSHICQALDLINNTISIIIEINDYFSKKMLSATELKLSKINILKKIKTNVVRSNASVNKYINGVLENIRFKVEESLKFEIKHINTIVKDFIVPFSSDTTHLLIYKTELNNFVENKIDSRLYFLCSNAIKYEVSKFKQFLLEEYSNLLKLKIDKCIIDTVERFNEHNITVPCNSLFSDFKEDLSFQWPFSPYSLFNNTFTIYSLVRTQVTLNYSFQSPPDRRFEAFRPLLAHIHEILINRQFLSFCFMTALFSKISGSSIVFSSICSYSLLYFFEKVRWNMSTQEIIFKKQYVRYALKQLSNIVDISARSYSSLIKQELQMNHKSLARYIDNEIARMESEINKLNNDIVDLNEYITSINLLKYDAEAIKIQCQNFKSKYF